MAHRKRFFFGSFGQGDLTNVLVSISHLSWICMHQKFCRVSFEIIFTQKQLPRAPCFQILKYYIFFFLISYQEQFQPVKYYLSKSNTSRNVKLKILLKFSFLVFWLISFSSALNTYGTLKMSLLSIQTLSYIIVSSYIEASMKKLQFEFHVFSSFPGLQNLDVFFGKFAGELVLKSLSG